MIARQRASIARYTPLDHQRKPSNVWHIARLVFCTTCHTIWGAGHLSTSLSRLAQGHIFWPGMLRVAITAPEAARQRPWRPWRQAGPSLFCVAPLLRGVAQASEADRAELVSPNWGTHEAVVDGRVEGGDDKGSDAGVIQPPHTLRDVLLRKCATRAPACSKSAVHVLFMCCCLWCCPCVAACGARAAVHVLFMSMVSAACGAERACFGVMRLHC